MQSQGQVTVHPSQGDGRHPEGNWPALLLGHPFRLVLPGMSKSLSYSQVEKGQPSWQCPHGTKVHDIQPRGDGTKDGALLVDGDHGTLGMVLGAELGSRLRSSVDGVPL